MQEYEDYTWLLLIVSHMILYVFAPAVCLTRVSMHHTHLIDCMRRADPAGPGPWQTLRTSQTFHSESMILFFHFKVKWGQTSKYHNRVFSPTPTICICFSLLFLILVTNGSHLYRPMSSSYWPQWLAWLPRFPVYLPGFWWLQAPWRRRVTEGNGEWIGDVFV